MLVVDGFHAVVDKIVVADAETKTGTIIEIKIKIIPTLQTHLKLLPHKNLTKEGQGPVRMSQMTHVLAIGRKGAKRLTVVTLWCAPG